MIGIDVSYQLTYTHDIHDNHDTNTKVTFTDKLFEKFITK